MHRTYAASSRTKAMKWMKVVSSRKRRTRGNLQYAWCCSPLILSTLPCHLLPRTSNADKWLVGHHENLCSDWWTKTGTALTLKKYVTSRAQCTNPYNATVLQLLRVSFYFPQISDDLRNELKSPINLRKTSHASNIISRRTNISRTPLLWRQSFN